MNEEEMLNLLITKLSTLPGTLENDTLLLLHAVFGKMVIGALEIVERDALVQLNDGCFNVKGGGGEVYACSLLALYCECPAFTHQRSVEESTTNMCKHLVAAFLSKYSMKTSQTSPTSIAKTGEEIQFWKLR